jgi:SAM-dependent methyltransferase
MADKNARCRPAVGGVDFGDLGRVEPIGRKFGIDRGSAIDRYYIEAFLAAHADRIGGRVLEIGEDLYTSRFGGERVTGLDILDVPGSENPDATIMADLADGAGVPSAAFDCILLIQTLHMIYDIRGVLRTVHRALKPGRTLLATLPGISQIDAQDGPDKWFWFMTQSAAARLFGEGFGDASVTVTSYGNVLAATGFLQGLAVEDIEPGALDVTDPLYPMLTGVCAVKAADRPFGPSE